MKEDVERTALNVMDNVEKTFETNLLVGVVEEDEDEEERQRDVFNTEMKRISNKTEERNEENVGTKHDVNNELLYRVRCGSKVQFRAPDIIDL